MKISHIVNLLMQLPIEVVVEDYRRSMLDKKLIEAAMQKDAERPCSG
jgi:hypothetical protein